MAAEIKGSSLNLKIRSQNRVDKSLSSPKAKSKQEKSITSKHFIDSKKKSVPMTSKTETKGKATSTSLKTTTSNSKQKEKTKKKVYSLPGQKYDPPEEREPLRIFYESLHNQIPSSEMALFWMMEHGLLSPEKAKKASEKKQRRQQQLKLGTPIKSSKIEKPESSRKTMPSKNRDLKAQKRVLDSSDDDNHFISKYKKGKW